MSLVENYAAERRARLIRLGTIPAPVPMKPRGEIIAFKPAIEIFVPPVEEFYPSFWCWDLVTCQSKRPATAKNIMEVVGADFGVSVFDIISARRHKSLLMPRFIAVYLCRKLTLLSLNQIGQRFGGRDHATIRHAIRKIEAEMETDPVLSNRVLYLQARFE
jgi:hypothetical protein